MSGRKAKERRRQQAAPPQPVFEPLPHPNPDPWAPIVARWLQALKDEAGS